MPIYDFICRKCATKFEFIKVRSDDVVQCPQCQVKGEKNLEQQVSTGTGFNLQGGGWYRDNYQRGPKK